MSFDINCTGQFLCAGTEKVKDDSYLLFWDIRSTKHLGGYWESHQDDVSHVNLRSALIFGLIINSKIVIVYYRFSSIQRSRTLLLRAPQIAL